MVWKVYLIINVTVEYLQIDWFIRVAQMQFSRLSLESQIYYLPKKIFKKISPIE